MVGNLKEPSKPKNAIYLRINQVNLDTISTTEYQRYARHFNLPNFGAEAQQKLKGSNVLVVGAGGLGAPLLLYLAAAGIGHIGIIDPDVIDISNLQRQVLYQSDHIGESKVTSAAQRIKALNPHIKVTTYNEYLGVDNALEIINDYDIIADGSDNFPTRYLVNDACVICDKPNVYASIYQYEGQVAVFNHKYKDGSHGPHYRDLFPHPPIDGLVPDCATGGVLGVLAGIIGSMQALEVIKVCTDIGRPLTAKLLIYDALTCESRVIKLQKNSHTKVTHLINYEDFCGVTHPTNQKASAMKEISVIELKLWRDSDKDFQLIDVREQNEIDFVNIGGQHIPMGEIMLNINKISDDKDIVVMCRSGKRSADVINALQRQGKSNLYNLKGGILAWAKEIDTSLPTY